MEGRIDWFVTSEPLPLQIQHSGDGIVMANSRTVPEWSGSYAGYGQVVVTRSTYAKQNSDTVSGTVRGVRPASRSLVRPA
ncbi:hypothetical protein [Streptomyces mangrovisoli]|uniref:Uncharacterized protein n=1 Tax=Streptomyces mangrovisoli TaxID=1428628 RepID=A0A1J4NS04_9ACTN|nr:hypothetical protein [Streptomyces mangrovisoli]OIJ63942.1 hypothetical protein WN71_031585 [Streptomyces mangrovisoli]